MTPPTPRDREVRVTDANEAGSWKGILGPDEQIEWQDAPVQGVLWEFSHRETLGAIAAAAGAIMVVVFISETSPDVGRMPLVLLAWGVIAAVVYHARSLWNRRRTFYTLTNQRAFIATWHFGVQRLRAYPIATTRPLRLVDTQPGHIWFDHDRVRRKDRLGGNWKDQIVEVGLQHLANPREVHDLLVRHGAVPG